MVVYLELEYFIYQSGFKLYHLSVLLLLPGDSVNISRVVNIPFLMRTGSRGLRTNGFVLTGWKMQF